MPRQPRLDTPGTLHQVRGWGIERGAGKGSEAVDGACTEDTLPGGGEVVGVYKDLPCTVFKGDDFVGRSISQFRRRG